MVSKKLILTLSLFLSLSQAGKCPFGYGSSSAPTQKSAVQLNTQTKSKAKTKVRAKMRTQAKFNTGGASSFTNSAALDDDDDDDDEEIDDDDTANFGGGTFGGGGGTFADGASDTDAGDVSDDEIDSIDKATDDISADKDDDDEAASNDTVDGNTTDDAAADDTVADDTAADDTTTPDTTDDSGPDFSKILYPSHALVCKKESVQFTQTFTKKQYDAIFNDTVALIDSQSLEKRRTSAGCWVRLAGHDFMDFRRKGEGESTGGSDGCINFQDPDNMGLAQCIHHSNLQSLYEKWCDVVSLADFIVLIGQNVIGRLATDYDAQDPFKKGTMNQKFRSGFHFGRTTVEHCSQQNGLMPNPEEGCQGLKNIMVDHVYYERHNWHRSWLMVAAISGAHTLGQARVENSGYNGFWSEPEDQGTFNNGYYKNMLKRGWGPERGVAGNVEKNQWKRIDHVPCDDTHHELMLNTDICLAYQHNTKHAECMKEGNRNVGRCNKFQRKGEFLYAHNNTCCAWANVHIMTHRGNEPDSVVQRGNNDYCGVNAIDGNMRGICCKSEDEDSIGDCDAFNWPKGIMFDHILKMAKNEPYFYQEFITAWKRATNNGFPKSLQRLE